MRYILSRDVYSFFSDFSFLFLFSILFLSYSAFIPLCKIKVPQTIQLYIDKL